MSDLFSLPSLREAKLIAGKKAKNNIVNSITVLESTDPVLLQSFYFNHKQFRSNEIIITGFLNNPTDIEAQCGCIKGLHKAGACGLIIFYLGVVMQEIDQALLDISDQLGFPLIIMPYNRNILYGEVITDVIEAVFRQKQQSTYFAGDILERVSQISDEQRTLDYLLKIISSHTQYSLALFDSSMNIMHVSTWPVSSEDFFVEFLLNELRLSYDFDEQIYQREGGHFVNYVFCRLKARNSAISKICIVSEKGEIGQSQIGQIIEVIRLFINIWGKTQKLYDPGELIKAIIKNEPLKMRKLSEMFRIDLKSLKAFWIVSSNDKSTGAIEKTIASIKSFFELRHIQFIGDLCGDNIAILIKASSYEINPLTLAQEFMNEFDADKNQLTVTLMPKLTDIEQIRELYRLFAEYEQSAKKIYPQNRVFTLAHLNFTKLCVDEVNKGEEIIKSHMAILDGIHSENGQWKLDLISTLSVYLLDSCARVTNTAEILYAHKSTIKYRIKVISDRLCCNIQKMPEAYPLYFAVAVRRLLLAGTTNKDNENTQTDTLNDKHKG